MSSFHVKAELANLLTEWLKAESKYQKAAGKIRRLSKVRNEAFAERSQIERQMKEHLPGETPIYIVEHGQAFRVNLTSDGVIVQSIQLHAYGMPDVIEVKPKR